MIDRVALLACIRQNEPVTAFKRYVDLKAGLHLWLGDNIYADTKELSELQRCYAKLKSQPFFDSLRLQGIHLATWDDHDFGWNDAGKHYPLKAASKNEFRKFWKLEESIPEDQQGIYYAREFDMEDKRLQVLMLDVRYHRDDPGPESDVLGAAQWTWLEEQLSKPADLRLLVSGFQILLGPDTGSESWSTFPRARKQLFDLIRQRNIENLIFVTGDQHYGEVSRLRGALGYDAIEFQFAGLNQIEDPEFNPLRVSSVCQSKNSYAWLDIQWETTQTDVPHIVFRIHNADNDQPELIYRVNFSELLID
jgi:alkaline phosphatase D